MTRSALWLVCMALAATTAAQAPAGSAFVDVSVVDGHGTPLSGATVKLSGPVNREAVSDASGAVSFAALPAGRYDVVASRNGLAPSAPRVLDLASYGITSITATVKPTGQTRMMMACGGYDPSTLATLARSGHLVLHVKVLAQRTIERPLSPGDTTTYFATLNDVRRLESFGPGPTTGLYPTVIQQGGGRIDRGEAIDFFTFNQLPPLNVGDEYVLFLFVDSAGTATPVGSEEGVFRIRNGRVHPLGRGGAATTWVGRTAAEFLEALRRLK